jgi:hypothetical protein
MVFTAAERAMETNVLITNEEKKYRGQKCTFRIFTLLRNIGCLSSGDRRLLQEKRFQMGNGDRQSAPVNSLHNAIV